MKSDVGSNGGNWSSQDWSRLDWSCQNWSNPDRSSQSTGLVMSGLVKSGKVKSGKRETDLVDHCGYNKPELFSHDKDQNVLGKWSLTLVLNPTCLV